MLTLVVIRIVLIALSIVTLIAFGIRPGQTTSVPRFSRNRRKNPLNVKDLIASYEFTTPDIIVTLDTPFVLSGIPQLLTDTNKLPISATWISPTSFKVTYDTPGSVTEVTVPQKDAAVRSATGGWLAPGTFPAA